MKYQKPEMANMGQLLDGGEPDAEGMTATVAVIAVVVGVLAWVFAV